MELKQNSSLLGWNTRYISSFQGILNICQIVLGCASLELLKDSCRPAYSSTAGGFVGSASETYFYLCGAAALIITCIIFFSFTISHASCTLMERTILCIMFWMTTCVLSFLTSGALLLYVTAPSATQVYAYSHKVAASLLGFINSGLYLASMVKSYKICKNCWSH